MNKTMFFLFSCVNPAILWRSLKKCLDASLYMCITYSVITVNVVLLLLIKIKRK